MHITRLVVSLCLGAVVAGAAAHAQFAFGIGGAGMEYGKALTLDRSGNAVVGFLFQGSVDVDPNGTALLQSRGGVDAAVTVYSPTGALVRAFRVGGSTTTDAPHGVAVDAAGNIYLTGYFGSQQDAAPHTADFNPAGGGTLTSVSNFDAFLAKYDSTGAFQWAIGLGNTGGNTEERAWDIALDAQDNVIIAGAMHGTVNFNPRGAAAPRSIAGADAGLFIASYTPDGINLWAHAIDAHCTDVFTEAYTGVDIDAAGNVYLAGNFRGAGVSVHPQSAALITSAGQADMFLAKYTPAGSLLWVKRMGGTAQDIVSPGAMRLDKLGRPFLTGRIAGTVNFNTSGGSNTVSGANLFLAAYDSSGSLRHAFGMPSNAGDGGHRVSFDAQNNVYIAGWMNGTVDFDPVGTRNITAVSPTADWFLAKYTNNGTSLWAFSVGASNSQQNNICAGLAVTAAGEAYVTGQWYGDNADFDPSPGAQRLLSSAGQNDCFVAKYDASGNLLPVELVSFLAQRSDADVRLTWTTAAELNNAGFIIERELPGASFTSIAFIPGAGTTSLSRSYVHLDRDAPATSARYRLRQIDTDGAEQLSHTVDVPAPASTDATIWPTVLSGRANTARLHVYCPSGAPQRLHIVDPAGRLFIDMSPSHGWNEPWSAELDFRGAPAGVFVITLETDQGLRTARILVTP